MKPQEAQEVRSLLNRVIVEGDSYPQSKPLTDSEFTAYWLAGDAYVVRAGEEVLGAFYIKPNFPGRSSHICNAGFIVQPACRRMGIGRWMGTSMLQLAQQAGYKAVVFNLVFETNTASIALWRSLGFSTIGRIPNAVRLNNGRLIDSLILYRHLDGIPIMEERKDTFLGRK